VRLTLSTHASGDVTIIEATGEMDMATAPQLREEIIDLVTAGPRRVLLDVSRVSFLDSSGLSVLVGGLKRLREHGATLELVGPQERVLKVLRITGLTKTFTIFDTVDAALAQGINAPT
jgi:anti-sigma B factor antagonist